MEPISVMLRRLLNEGCELQHRFPSLSQSATGSFPFISWDTVLAKAKAGNQMNLLANLYLERYQAPLDAEIS